MKWRRVWLLAPLLILAAGVSVWILSRPAPPLTPMQRIARLIGDVPSVASGHIAYDDTDDHRAPLAVLNPIPDPHGGYIGVYDFPSGGKSLAHFKVAVARSYDLVHWIRVRVLDVAAVGPTLAAFPGGHGYLLAEEKYSAAKPWDHVRLRYYRSVAAMLAGRVAKQLDLPIRYSRYTDGTPSFFSIKWNGGLRRSVLQLGFHYLSSGDGPRHEGPDLEADARVTGFRRWLTHKDTRVNQELDRVGLRGKHGDRSQFRLWGQTWRLYEGQTRYVPGDFYNWRLALYNVRSGAALPISLHTATGTYSTSYGAPVVQIEPGPHNSGPVLIVTMFVYRAGSGEGGELVFYKPLEGRGGRPLP